jgi:hypothetical protein
MGSAPYAIPAVLLILGALYAFGRWQWEAIQRRSAALEQAVASHPAARSAQGPVPGAERDGEPLTADEWAMFNGCLFASHQHVDEPDYGGHRA